MMWKLSRAPGSPRHAWATGKWPRRSFFLSSKTSLQRLRIRQMSLFGWVSSSTRESRIDWRRHSGIFEGRKQDGPQNIRRLGWITGLRFFFPLRSYTYGYTTGKTAHLSLFLNRFKQWDSPQGQRRRQPYRTATLQERRKLNALTLLLPLLLDGNLGLRRPDSMSSTKWAEFWDLSKIKYLLWVSLFSRYV